MAERPTYLFSAFEHSGDALAAAVITQLLKRQPDAKVYAFGGRRAEAAGAELIETTTQHATMFLETLKHAWAHQGRLRRLKRWLADHPLTALVPTDSPAANWSICKLVRRAAPDARIVHLAAPQLWAWAPWRIGKLRYCTDHVLCLLPFEPAWFQPRDVPSTFVGHPLFEKDYPGPPEVSHPVTRLALLPGSRSSEIEKNWPTMLAAAKQLLDKHPNLEARVAALDEQTVEHITTLTGELPPRVTVSPGAVDDVLTWSQVVLAVSGTVTLETAAYRRPMVIFYNVSRAGYNLARWALTTDTFTLPNLIGNWLGLGHVAPELTPHFGAVEPIVAHVDRLIADADAWALQRRHLDEVVRPFAGRHFGVGAAEKLLAIVGGS